MDIEKTFTDIANRTVSLPRSTLKGAAALAKMTAEEVDWILSENSPVYRMFQFLFPNDDGNLWQQFTEWCRRKVSLFHGTPKSGDKKGQKGGDSGLAITSKAGQVASGLKSNAAADKLDTEAAKGANVSQSYAALSDQSSKMSRVVQSLTNSLSNLNDALNPKGGTGGPSRGSSLEMGTGGGPTRGSALERGTGGPAAGSPATMGIGNDASYQKSSDKGISNASFQNAFGRTGVVTSIFRGLLNANKSSSPTAAPTADAAAATAGAGPPAGGIPSGSAAGGNNYGTGGVINPQGGMNSTSRAVWAKTFLSQLGAPMTPGNLQFVYDWQISEGGSGNNPLNTGKSKASSTGNSSAGGAAGYSTVQSGIDGAIEYVGSMSNYRNLKAKLMDGSSYQADVAALIASPWAASHYGGRLNSSPFPTGLARGSQEIDRDGLRYLHRGERVTPAAENTTIDRYSRGKASTGGVLIHLEFKAGSITLGPGSSQMDAKAFVDQVSTRLENHKTIKAIARG